MTYKIKRTIHPTFQEQKLEAEVELSVNESRDEPNPRMQTTIEAIKVLWITDEQGNEIWHHGNGKPSWGSISPELGLIINGECEKIEDLNPDGE